MDLKVPFNDLFVSTKETITLSHFFNFYMKYNQHMLVSGNTGTGKTRIVLTEIAKICANPENKKAMIPINFSAQTSVNDLQNQMEG
mmetsp:Transcript_44966/g.98246  ORF Transcript_44966/g.98246 Transcript_44966/m.98246 type:complete len:86 (+) Transcript_44966:1560-1817(+)